MTTMMMMMMEVVDSILENGIITDNQMQLPAIEPECKDPVMIGV